MEIYTTPTREEFFDYAYKHGWNDWAEELWEEMNRTNWLKNDGTQQKIGTLSLMSETVTSKTDRTSPTKSLNFF